MERKAVPIAVDSDRPYWEAARAHRLVLQRCAVCGLYGAQPRVVCPRCHGESFDWSQVSGRGLIYSYTIVRQSSVLGFEDEVPYVLVHVQVDEDPLCCLTTNLLIDEKDYALLDIGLPVEVVFEERADVTVPQFRLR